MSNPEDRVYLELFPFLTPEARQNIEEIAAVLDGIRDTVQRTGKVALIDKQQKVLMQTEQKVKTLCVEVFKDGQLWRQVPEMQKLVGGTIERPRDISIEQYEQILLLIKEALVELRAIADIG